MRQGEKIDSENPVSSGGMGINFTVLIYFDSLECQWSNQGSRESL